jgi:8-oxo-dGTP diphosphatase
MKSIRVVCAIIEQDGKILAAKRGRSQSHGGFWEFPGGKVCEGEDPRHAIVREIREELGAEISVVKELGPVTQDYADKRVTLLPFVCRAGAGVGKAIEHEEIRLVDNNEAASLPWLPPDREILKRYTAGLSASEKQVFHK